MASGSEKFKYINLAKKAKAGKGAPSPAKKRTPKRKK